jgi:predicted transcriptional regulator
MTGPELRAARQQLGLTQRKLAARIGCYQADVCRLERGLAERAAAALRTALAEQKDAA